MWDREDTISAISTAIGEGGIGIVRMSGPDARAVADKLFASPSGRPASASPDRKAVFGHIADPDNGRVIDEVLLLTMAAPRSYTREDVVEIHCHGGPVALRQILALTLRFGARLAEPGEFTKRAFLNARLDLAQAEAVMDVIRAKTDASLKMAVSHLSGALSGEIRSLRDLILGMIAHLEAAIDYPEEDIEELTAQEVAETVHTALDRMDQLLLGAQTGRILRDGLQTVIVGKPNVGKSSLLNALLRENRAIVTEVPGTTRDVIEEYLNVRGVPLRIMDTAGIRATADVVEKIGVEKTRESLAKADLVLVVLDSSLPLTQEDKEVMAALSSRPAIVLINKSDLAPVLDYDEVSSLLPGKRIFRISVQRGEGIDELEEAIAAMAYQGQVSGAEASFVSNVRHIHLLERSREHLTAALATIDANMPSDCIVVDLRDAWQLLGDITGDTVGEDIIDQIFSRFCIGK